MLKRGHALSRGHTLIITINSNLRFTVVDAVLLINKPSQKADINKQAAYKTIPHENQPDFTSKCGTWAGDILCYHFSLMVAFSPQMVNRLTHKKAPVENHGGTLKV